MRACAGLRCSLAYFLSTPHAAYSPNTWVRSSSQHGPYANGGLRDLDYQVRGRSRKHGFCPNGGCFDCYGRSCSRSLTTHAFPPPGLVHQTGFLYRNSLYTTALRFHIAGSRGSWTHPNALFGWLVSRRAWPDRPGKTRRRSRSVSETCYTTHSRTTDLFRRHSST